MSRLDMLKRNIQIVNKHKYIEVQEDGSYKPLDPMQLKVEDITIKDHLQNEKILQNDINVINSQLGQLELEHGGRLDNWLIVGHFDMLKDKDGYILEIKNLPKDIKNGCYKFVDGKFILDEQKNQFERSAL